MNTIKFTLKPEGVFATPLQGDTLFGQLCWALLRTQGEEKLKTLLAQYASAPFAVVSDAFPSGYLPRPSLPSHFLGGATQDPKTRKEMKRKHWVPSTALSEPISEWLQYAKSDKDILQEINSEQTQLQEWQRHMHNSINRMTGTTGEAGFAPYAVDELWHAQNILWDIYIVVDKTQISVADIEALIQHIGKTGYGKDANLGAGRFSVTAKAAANFTHHTNANAVLALSAVAPQGLPLNPQGCFYQPFTRYGRHGDWAALVNPFKAPILLAKAAAVLMPEAFKPVEYIGQALGGNGDPLKIISKTIPQTVHQGYAPVLHIHLPLMG